MGKLEERLVEAMSALCDDEPECDRHMFVFPVRSMNVLGYLSDHPNVARVDDVLLIRRGDTPAENP